MKEGDGETKRLSELQSELFAISAKANDDTLDLVCFDVLTITDSASSGECPRSLFSDTLDEDVSYTSFTSLLSSKET